MSEIGTRPSIISSLLLTRSSYTSFDGRRNGRLQLFICNYAFHQCLFVFQFLRHIGQEVIIFNHAQNDVCHKICRGCCSTRYKSLRHPPRKLCDAHQVISQSRLRIVQNSLTCHTALQDIHFSIVLNYTGFYHYIPLLYAVTWVAFSFTELIVSISSLPVLPSNRRVNRMGWSKGGFISTALLST